VETYHNKTGKVRNIYRSCNNCCSTKALLHYIHYIIITYCEYGFVALAIQHAMQRRHIVICGLSGSTIFFPHYLINGTILEKKSYWKQNVCFDFLCNFWNIYHSKKNWARYNQMCILVNCLVFIIERECVHCAVRTGASNRTAYFSPFKC